MNYCSPILSDALHIGLRYTWEHMLWIKRMKDVSSEAELTHHQQYMVGKSVGRLYAQTSNCELKRQWVYFSTEVYELLVTTHTPTKRCNTLPTFLDAASRARTQWLTFKPNVDHVVGLQLRTRRCSAWKISPARRSPASRMESVLWVVYWFWGQNLFSLPVFGMLNSSCPLNPLGVHDLPTKEHLMAYVGEYRQGNPSSF